jgi:hypothetical protein
MLTFQIIPKTLFLRSTSREAGDLVLDLSKSSPQSSEYTVCGSIADNAVNIKEGVEYSVGA